jgi:biopolymer transport protein TolR
MGGSLQKGGGSSRRGGRRKRSSGALSEINVTPMVDVMLVLLIVFMIAAPLLTVSVPIDLPKVGAKTTAQQEKPPLTVSVKKNGDIFLMETQLTLAELLPKLAAIAKNGVEERIFVRADAEATHQSVLSVLSSIQGGGYSKVALIGMDKNAK